MFARRRRSHLAMALCATLLVTLGCFGCDVIDRLRGRLGDSSAPVTERDATPWATLDPAQRVDGLAEIPSEPGRLFEVQVLEQEINERIRSARIDRDGIAAAEPRVTLADGSIIGSVNVRHQESGISVTISFRGQPRVVDGRVLFVIEDVSLGDSVRGVARLLLQGMIDEVLKQVEAEKGISVPLPGLDNVEVLAVRVEPGALIVTGRTR